MRRLRVAVIDLVTKGPTRAIYARAMHANMASIMPQVIATWCEAEGHEVSFVCYTGLEDLSEQLPAHVDLVFIGSFTEAALLAYSLSNRFRSLGAVTALGGPHARCYPEDAARHFDYVLGFTDREVIRDVLRDCSRHRPRGVHLSADKQPLQLPGVQERWKYIEATLRKAPVLKIVPMLASLGCPYTCSFCIDSTVPYQPLDLDVLKEDLRFLLRKTKRPRVAWHDPNFGVRFDETLDAIEEAAPPDSIDFIAESSLSLLSEPHLQRLQRNGFKAVLPGIESWYELGNKSRTASRKGAEKVQQVSEHVRLILKYLPYVQTNFVLGLDVDEGEEPFELTKRFVDLTPGAFPGYSLLSAFGRAAPLNLEFQPAMRGAIPRWMNVVRAVSSEGFGRIAYYTEVRRRLDTDRPLRRYFEQETTELPEFFTEQVRKDLGPFWDSLPAEALHHDPNAYLMSETVRPPSLRAAAPG